MLTKINKKINKITKKIKKLKYNLKKNLLLGGEVPTYTINLHYSYKIFKRNDILDLY
jgi:hypothetical protein